MTKREGSTSAARAFERAREAGQGAARLGFDWESAQSALAKVYEEADELGAELGRSDRAAAEEELGDLLFAVCMVARLADLDAERALDRAVSKFKRRWAATRAELARRGIELPGAALDEIERVWGAIKRSENA